MIFHAFGQEPGSGHGKLAYKDDPDIIAFEICNEPHHGGTAEETRRFINRMVDAIRITDCRKPVFYNASHSIHLAEAYFSSRIQGGTFQWYPSGLVAGHEMKGNFLPNVTAYIHPYMAKSFREAGIQFAAQFSYDPMFMAHANTKYQTHYMNLSYTPRKALSLMIAAEAFRSMPPGQKSGSYPADTLFGHFRVSYVNDLSEMVSREQFIHSNHTRSIPPHPEQLQRIAGAGSSPLVRKGKITEFSGRDPWKGGMLGEFVAPPTNCDKTYLLHDPPQEITAGINLKVRVRVVSTEGPESVELFLYRGFLQYYVVVTDEEGSRFFFREKIAERTDNLNRSCGLAVEKVFLK